MLFLDLDGTLLHVRNRYYAAYTTVLAHKDVRGQPIPEREFWDLWQEAKTLDLILQRSRLLPMKFAAFKSRFEARLEAPELLSLDEASPGLHTFLGKVYTKTPIVLVTQRRDGEALEDQLALLRVRKFFAEVLFGAPPPSKRPDRTLRYRHKAALIQARYRILPAGALYLGDTETDVAAARVLGFDVWLVEGGNRKRAVQMKADPDRLVPHLPASLEFMLPGGRWSR